MQQPKVNQKHVKWVEFLQGFTFVIKHASGKANRVVDSLSRKSLMVQESQVQVLGFDFIKYLYKYDIDFKEAYEISLNPYQRDRGPYFKDTLRNYYIFQEGLLFKDIRLCIP